ncbi:thioredoxin family protein [Rhabdobacter roseus]|uniref:Peroxiredoxin n=1 Tax=Rhabdobacter roseus TaxID=1655419 RepID=A0A840TNN4_9BACT|nr:thioredoxin family protein [Rhabdobacter roseus]MBB5282823.1 peroxiredoxin [Rhabdobacter roseus]
MNTDNAKRRITLWMVLAFLTSLGAVAVALSLPAQLRTRPDAGLAPAGYQVGEAVANFRLKNVNGSMVSLSDYSSKKGVMVVFTCNHCPFAKAYEDRIIALHAKFASQGYPVLAVNPSDPTDYEDDTFEKMKERASSKGYPYPYLADDAQTVAQAFGATRTPHVFVLKNSGGRFVVQYIGTIDDNPQDPAGVTKRYVDDAVTNLLANKPVVTTTTKAIGCAIKWKDI